MLSYVVLILVLNKVFQTSNSNSIKDVGIHMDNNHFIFTKETCENMLDHLINVVEEMEYTLETKISPDKSYSYWKNKEGA